MRKPENLVGHKFGRLLVINLSPKRDKRETSYWFCKCDCGNLKEICRSDFLNKNTQSCGCIRTEYLQSKKNIDCAFQKLLYTYKKNAKARGLEFNLSESEFRTLTKQNCFYCNSFPSSKLQRGNKNEYNYIYNGIDRVDNTKGYSICNCVPCCKKCNRMKMDFSKKDFLEQIAKISQYLNL